MTWLVVPSSLRYAYNPRSRRPVYENDRVWLRLIAGRSEMFDVHLSLYNVAAIAVLDVLPANEEGFAEMRGRTSSASYREGFYT